MVDFSTKLIADGGLPGVFLLMVLENLFPPIPSEVIMPLAGFTAARGQMSILGVILAGTLGSIAGNAVWFEAARAFGAARTRALVERHGRWFGLGPEEVGKAEGVLRRNGPLARLALERPQDVGPRYSEPLLEDGGEVGIDCGMPR